MEMKEWTFFMLVRGQKVTVDCRLLNAKRDRWGKGGGHLWLNIEDSLVEQDRTSFSFMLTRRNQGQPLKPSPSAQ